MIDRRTLLGLMAGSLVATAAPALAEDWKAKYPEVVFALIPEENGSGVVDRWTPFCEYMSKELGIKVTLRVAQDYAAVIEGQRAGQIQFAYYGPASYARARMTGAKIEPFAIEVNDDGTTGYHSVFYVKKDSPYKTVEDLKGKNFGLVDPNSTSGNNVPRFALDKMGINPDTFFGKVVYTGSHENAIIALGQGTVDGAANWWNNESESNLRRMERKGMAKYDDYRIIYTSELIVNSPFAVLSDLPAELKTAFAETMLAIPTKNPALFDKLYQGKRKPWQTITHDAYLPIIELNKFVDELRKKKS
jgi:phosphonate transport system substrate-binding protein